MNETLHEIAVQGSPVPAPRTHSLFTKILVIIGFCATVGLIVWLIVLGIARLPEGFSSLAGIADTIHDYRPLTTIKLTTEKEVVNSGETFLLSWTNIQQSGTYALHYACVDGVTLTAHDSSDTNIPFNCDDALSFPATVHSLSVSALSAKNRFANIQFTITFTDAKDTKKLSDEITVRIVNASIPFIDLAPEEEPAGEEKDETPVTPTEPAPKPVVNPIVTTVYPKSDPKGFVDLKVITLGAGTLVNGTFIPTAYYRHDLQNAIKFDIKNIGTKTSDTWTFTTKLPSGVIYKSKPQVALKPLEHVEFTLSFGLDGEHDDSTKVTTTVFTDHDHNSKNDTSVWTVVIND